MSEISKKFDIQNFLKFRKLQNKPYPIPNQDFFKQMIYGGKGESKTTLALAVPGDILINSYEDLDNCKLPIKNFYGNDPRYQVKGYDQFISKEDGEIWKESSNFVWNLTIKSLKMLEANNIKFDWVITDGYHELTKIAEMRMRFNNQVSAYGGIGKKGGAPRTIWNERKQMLDDYYSRVKKIAKYGVIFTSMDKTSEETKDDVTVEKEPIWQGKLKNDVSTQIKTSRVTRTAGKKIINSFYANIQGCKISCLSGRYNITLKFDEQGNLIVNKETGLSEFSPVYLMKKLLTTKIKVDLNNQW
jgi:hypothetical protein